jgi:hypothetical protein
VVRAIGEHNENILVILPGEHGITAVDAAGKERHAFILHAISIQSKNTKVEKIPRADQLRQNVVPVIGSVGRIISHCAVVIHKADEAGVFNAV